MYISPRTRNILMLLINGALIWWMVRQTPPHQQGVLGFALVFLSIVGWVIAWIILNADREGVFRKMKPPKQPKK